jgi:hypothetical protein
MSASLLKSSVPLPACTATLAVGIRILMSMAVQRLDLNRHCDEGKYGARMLTAPFRSRLSDAIEQPESLERP